MQLIGKLGEAVGDRDGERVSFASKYCPALVSFVLFSYPWSNAWPYELFTTSLRLFTHCRPSIGNTALTRQTGALPPQKLHFGVGGK